ncbi:hypothetical protein SBBP2_570055 [Burkholderiales bacterium]|nr:hypothetical protein SBBP2_570055 [Burkholderiales bacterium]
MLAATRFRILVEGAAFQAEKVRRAQNQDRNQHEHGRLKALNYDLRTLYAVGRDRERIDDEQIRSEYGAGHEHQFKDQRRHVRGRRIRRKQGRAEHENLRDR